MRYSNREKMDAVLVIKKAFMRSNLSSVATGKLTTEELRTADEILSQIADDYTRAALLETTGRAYGG